MISNAFPRPTTQQFLDGTIRRFGEGEPPESIVCQSMVPLPFAVTIVRWITECK